jgi:hypothetical protein
MMQPIRVFIASTPAEWLPARVLEFSIREATRAAIEVSQLHTFDRPIPTPIAIKNRPRTPFSFQRFLIPELCGQSGQAIYLDADMQVFRDIVELWTFPMQGCDLQTVAEGGKGRRGQFSVMLLDCAALGWDIDAIVASLNHGELNYEQLMYEMRVARRVGRDIPPEWNSLEHYEAGRTALLHYTDMNTQPWVSRENPLEPLWVSCLMRAIEADFISVDELRREVRSGHVRPSLLVQIERKVVTSRELGREAGQLDRSFLAPYKALKSGRASPWTSPGAFVKAVLRRVARGLRVQRWFN